MHKDWKKIVIKELKETVQPAFILVFGSFADHTAREDSDLDLAYYSDKTLNSYERFLLAGKISEQCNIDVDLIDIRQIDTVFAAQIYTTGKVIAMADENTFIKDRMRTLSMYVTLNEQREEILESIKERGTVYGE